MILIHSIWIFGLVYLLLLLLPLKTRQIYHLILGSCGALLALTPIPFGQEEMISIWSPKAQTWSLPWAYLYGMGVLIQLVRFGKGYFKIRRLELRGLSVDEGKYREMVRRLQEKWGIHRPIELRLVTNPTIPMVMGIFRHVIIFPVGLINQLELREVEAILAHEFHHIVNKDYAWNIFLVILEVIFFFNPFVHLIRRQVEFIREMECDLAAAQHIGDPIGMARTLLRIESYLKSPMLAMSIGGQGPLTRRIYHLIGREVPRYRGISFFTSVTLISLAGLFCNHREYRADTDQYTTGSSDTLALPNYNSPIDYLEFKTVHGEIKDVIVNDNKLFHPSALQLHALNKKQNMQVNTETNKVKEYGTGLKKKYSLGNGGETTKKVEQRNKHFKVRKKEKPSANWVFVDDYYYGKSNKFNEQELPELPAKIFIPKLNRKTDFTFLTPLVLVEKDRNTDLETLFNEREWWIEVLQEEGKKNVKSMKDYILDQLTREGLVDSEHYDICLDNKSLRINGVHVDEETHQRIRYELSERFPDLLKSIEIKIKKY